MEDKLAWKNLREALRKAPTEEARKQAVEAMNQYLAARSSKGKSSRPILVSLGKNKTYPNAIPLDKIPEEMETNPEFLELMRRIVK